MFKYSLILGIEYVDSPIFESQNKFPSSGYQPKSKKTKKKQNSKRDSLNGNDILKLRR